MSNANEFFRTIHDFRTIIGNAVFNEVAVKTNNTLNREELTSLNDSVQTVIDQKIDHLIVSLQKINSENAINANTKTRKRKNTK